MATFRIAFARRDFVWGTQLGWDGIAILEPPHRAKLEFLGRLARLRAAARDYLVYGELLEVLEPTNEVPSLSGTWNTPDGDGPVTLPAVHGALWRGHDGSAGILLANADTEPPYPIAAMTVEQVEKNATRWKESRPKWRAFLLMLSPICG